MNAQREVRTLAVLIKVLAKTGADSVATRLRDRASWLVTSGLAPSVRVRQVAEVMAWLASTWLLVRDFGEADRGRIRASVVRDLERWARELVEVVGE